MDDKKKQQTLQIAQAVIKTRNINVNITNVEVGEDGNSLVFYYNAPERRSLRALERELNREFKTKIELKEVSARNIASQIPGCGQCGRELCCRTWISNFPNITEEVAESLNCTYSKDECLGSCGKLKCCLIFETENPDKYFEKDSTKKQVVVGGKEKGGSRGEDSVVGGPPTQQSVVAGTR